MFRCIIPLIVGAVLVIGVCAPAATTFWHDGEFVEPDWELISWYAPQDSGDSDATLSFTLGHAGNPGAHRTVGIGLGAGPEDGAMLVQLRGGWTWYATTQGAITGIDVALDFMQTNGAPVRLGIVIEQDGELYVHVLDPMGDAAVWTTYPASGLTASDFAPIDPDASGQPDFSEGSGMMRFGFVTGQLAPQAGGHTLFYHGVDNVTVDITATEVVAIDDPPSIVRSLAAAPNPFNPNTTITFTLPGAADVALRLFDLRGRTVRTLVDDRLEAGLQRFEWNGRDAGGTLLASGVYLAALDTGRERLVRRLTLVQ